MKTWSWRVRSEINWMRWHKHWKGWQSMTMDIMNLTQQTWMMQNSILQAIRRQLLKLLTERKENSRTLTTEIFNKNYWVTGPSISSLQRLTLGLTIVLRLLERLRISLRRLRRRKASWTRRAAACYSARIIWTPRCVIQTGSYGTTPGDYKISVSNPFANSPVLIGGIGVPPTRENNKRL